MSKKDKKLPDWDDGRTVAPMNGDELPSYRRMLSSLGRKREKEKVNKDKENKDVFLSKEEQKAATKGMFAVLFPMFLVVIASFALVLLLLALWVK